LHLAAAELVARKLAAFSRDEPSITKELRLPNWEQSEKMAWPPPQVPLGVLVAQSMVPAAHPGRDWWRAKEGEARAQRERQEREEQEEQAKRDAAFHGPRWWKGERPGPEQIG
jgi:hypothetical protein